METRKGRATRRRIVDAATAAVREAGAAAATLDEVCRRSGTGKGQIFYYFPGGREELLLAVAESEAARVFDDQEPYLSQLATRADWETWGDLIVRQYRDQGLHCPLAVLISDVGRVSPRSQAVAAQLVARWQGSLRSGIERSQLTGEVDPRIDADRMAAAFIAAIEGGVTVLSSTGSATHLEAGLALCLDHLLSRTRVSV